MDKRSLFFFVSLSIALLVLNVYFSFRDQEAKREWQAQQKARKAKTSPTEQLAAPQVKQEQTSSISSTTPSPEHFYVLENNYQQVVLTSRGGAVVEINLPFHSTDNPQSIVREIEIDREMLEQHSYNDYFPAHPYYTPGTDPKGPYLENLKGWLGGYYPLLRRDLLARDERPLKVIPPQNYALNLVSEYPEISTLSYTVTHFDESSIVFEAQQNHRRIKRTYRFGGETNPAPYCLEMTLEIEGTGSDLWLTTGVPDVELFSGTPAPALKYRLTRLSHPEIESLELPKEVTTVSSVEPDWVCNSNGFFALILDPLTEVESGYKATHLSGKAVPSRLLALNTPEERFQASELPGFLMLLPLKAGSSVTSFRLYAGPLAESVLKAVDRAYTDPATGESPDYIAAISFHGWFAWISEPFAKFLFILMKFFYQLTHSWAFSIILLTVALKVMLYPLNAWSTKSMLRMQEIAPEITSIQEKYKKEPQKAQAAIMNLYREKRINPLSGCFPLLIQMPFLVGMFDLLKSTFELRGAGFIPGWIDNLAAPDVLFRWGPSIPFIGNEFHLLPVLLGLVMFAQGRLMASGPKDVNKMTDQQRQQRVMSNMMTVVFTVMFYQFPSGLNLYWISSMLLGFLQQWWTQRAMKQPKPQNAVLSTPKS